MQNKLFFNQELEKFSIFHFSCSGKINPCKTYRDLLLISRPLSTVFQKGAAPLIPLVAPSAPSTISKTPSYLFRKFFITYTKAAFLLLKISISIYDLSINRLHHKICHLLYGLTVVNYRWSKAISLNLRSFILMKDINKIIEVSAACGVQFSTLLILKISVTAARCYKYP